MRAAGSSSTAGGLAATSATPTMASTATSASVGCSTLARCCSTQTHTSQSTAPALAPRVLRTAFTAGAARCTHARGTKAEPWWCISVISVTVIGRRGATTYPLGCVARRRRSLLRLGVSRLVVKWSLHGGAHGPIAVHPAVHRRDAHLLHGNNSSSGSTLFLCTARRVVRALVCEWCTDASSVVRTTPCRASALACRGEEGRFASGTVASRRTRRRRWKRQFTSLFSTRRGLNGAHEPPRNTRRISEALTGPKAARRIDAKSIRGLSAGGRSVPPRAARRCVGVRRLGTNREGNSTRRGRPQRERTRGCSGAPAPMHPDETYGVPPQPRGEAAVPIRRSSSSAQRLCRRRRPALGRRSHIRPRLRWAPVRTECWATVMEASSALALPATTSAGRLRCSASRRHWLSSTAHVGVVFESIPMSRPPAYGAPPRRRVRLPDTDAIPVRRRRGLSNECVFEVAHSTPYAHDGANAPTDAPTRT